MGAKAKTPTAWVEKATGLLWSDEAVLDGRHRLVRRRRGPGGILEEDWILVDESTLKAGFKATPEAPEMVCSKCSGGAADARGAYTLCALCGVEEAGLAAAA